MLVPLKKIVENNNRVLKKLKAEIKTKRRTLPRYTRRLRSSTGTRSSRWRRSGAIARGWRTNASC